MEWLALVVIVVFLLIYFKGGCWGKWAAASEKPHPLPFTPSGASGWKLTPGTPGP